MDELVEQGLKVFQAGGPADPRPASNPLERRFARDLDCNLIVHFSPILKTWVYDDGAFHTGCRLEFPVEWIPPFEEAIP
jgi:hypothetical protein